MTPQQKQHVRETFAMVGPIAEQAATLFYSRLFEIAPHTRSLFHHNIDEQGKKLMQTLGVAVAHLDHLETIVPTIEQLGRRHVRYGVQPEDYDTVGAALLWTLAQGLGEAFTPAVEEAWATVYTVLADTMKQASYPATLSSDTA
ncbi:MAG: globin family protein [Chloroflexota bacterium]